VWRYCDDSARYIFGELLGDPLADEILQLLRATGRQGMTRTEISNALGRNIPSARISTVLARLQREHLLVCQQDTTRGRPVERWRLIETHRQATKETN
jgi:predicted ArsR family transcriptional regulator